MKSLLPHNFARVMVELSLEQILPRRAVNDSVRNTVRYQRILSSMREVGLVEPIVVYPAKEEKDRFLLLDGHLRFAAAHELGVFHLKCLVSADDEGYTYNKRVSHLATIQEHLMIVKALENGVSEEKLARALNVNIRMVKRKATLLDRICPEATELLKDKSVDSGVFDVLRKMTPLRQIEAAELMNLSAIWTPSYARALLAATRQEELAKPDKPKRLNGVSSEQMARMEIEMAAVQREFKKIEASYGDDILHLVVSAGFLSKLLSNDAVKSYLEGKYPELVQDFQAIVDSSTLDGRFDEIENISESAAPPD